VTTHPGEVLSEEFLVPLGMSVNALAMALRVPATRIGAIVKGERSVTADTALRLARFFGTSPEFWVNLQATCGRAQRDRATLVSRTSAASALARAERDPGPSARRAQLHMHSRNDTSCRPQVPAHRSPTLARP
jgi:addiction module HigA family antidote